MIPHIVIALLVRKLVEEEVSLKLKELEISLERSFMLNDF